MKTINLKNMCAVVLAVLFGAFTLISWQSNPAVLAFEQKGNDAGIGDERCEAKHNSESSTFGRCKNVCAGKTVTKDRTGGRYTCDDPKPKTIVKPTTIRRLPNGNDATLDASPGTSSSPKAPAPGVNNAGKAKQ